MTRRLLGWLVLTLSLALAGASCGSDGVTGTAAEALASCNAYCDAVITKACSPPPYTTAAECKMMTCDQAAMAPAGCQAAVKTYFDCEGTQSDLCADKGCSAQFTALTSCQ
jgi:hypothetical protein